MDYKVFIKLIIPEIERTLEVYIPINKTVGDVCKLLNNLVHEVSGNVFPVKEKLALVNRFTSQIYLSNVYIRDTDIRNGAVLVLI